MNKKRVTIIVAVIMALVAGTFLVGYGVSAGTDNGGADKKVTAEKEQKDEKHDKKVKEDKEVKEDELKYSQ